MTDVAEQVSSLIAANWERVPGVARLDRFRGEEHYGRECGGWWPNVNHVIQYHRLRLKMISDSLHTCAVYDPVHTTAWSI